MVALFPSIGNLENMLSLTLIGDKMDSGMHSPTCVSLCAYDTHVAFLC